MRLGVGISLLQGCFRAAPPSVVFKVYGVLCKGQVGLRFGFAGLWVEVGLGVLSEFGGTGVLRVLVLFSEVLNLDQWSWRW